MKTTKKLLCVMLTVLLLASVGAVAVSAQEPAEPDMEALHQKFIGYLDEKGIEHVDPDDPNIDNTSVTFIMKSNGWSIFKGLVLPIADMPGTESIGQYVFYSRSLYQPYEIGVYAEKEGEILTLGEAYDRGDIDIDELARRLFTSKPIDVDLGVRWIGDTNADNEINLVDVLNIQKLIAKKIYQLEDIFADPDYNQDGNINVKDVIDIQKRIAKII